MRNYFNDFDSSNVLRGQPLPSLPFFDFELEETGYHWDIIEVGSSLSEHGWIFVNRIRITWMGGLKVLKDIEFWRGYWIFPEYSSDNVL